MARDRTEVIGTLRPKPVVAYLYLGLAVAFGIGAVGAGAWLAVAALVALSESVSAATSRVELTPDLVTRTRPLLRKRSVAFQDVAILRTRYGRVWSHKTLRFTGDGGYLELELWFWEGWRSFLGTVQTIIEVDNRL